MADNYTILNPGVGGDVMDEVGVSGYSGVVSRDGTRKRPKVVISGPGGYSGLSGWVNDPDDMADVTTGTPPPNDYGLVVRPVVTCETPIVTTIPASTKNSTLLNPNDGRIYAAIFNDSTDSVLYIKLGVGATTNNYTVQLYPFGFFELPQSYIGQVDGIWDTSNGNAQVTEIT